MVCKLGTILSRDDPKVITVQMTADGNNFANGGALQEELVNVASVACAANSSATTPDPTCFSESRTSITVSVIWLAQSFRP
jgi:hypothetical protein